jgi:Fibronectin type III domain
MKNIIFSIIVIFYGSINFLIAQTYTSVPSIGTYNSCPNTNNNQSCGNFIGNTIKIKLDQVTASSFIFKIKKCSGTFSSAGAAYIKDSAFNGVCGNVLNGNGTTFSAGVSEITITIPKPTNFTYGTQTFYGTVNSSTNDKFWAGSIVITISCTDNYEPNNSFASANNNLGSSGAACDYNNLVSYIGAANDVDYYSIVLTGKGQIEGELLVPADYELELWKSTTMVGATSTSSGTASEFVSLDKTTTGTETWYFKIYAKVPGTYSCLSYTLTAEWQPTPDESQFTGTNITSTSFTASWAAIPGAVSYELKYKLANAPNYNSSPTLTTNTNSLNITGLSPNTSYKFQIRAKCNPANFGPWTPSSTGTFTTLGPAATSDLILNAATTALPNPGVQSQAGFFNAFVRNNNSSSPWTGDLEFRLIGTGVDAAIQTWSNITIQPNTTFNMNYSSQNISSPPGAYQIFVRAKTGNASFSNVAAGAQTNPINWSIIQNQAFLQLYQAINIVPTTIVYNQSANF